jgi:hypothetical protein
MLHIAQKQFNYKSRAASDTARYMAALVKVDEQILAIAGRNLRSVSSHNLSSNTWGVNLPPVNKARSAAAACFLSGQVYVFAGRNDEGKTFLNSIEKITATSLVSNGTGIWQFIQVL